jgi:hypothetical protein
MGKHKRNKKKKKRNSRKNEQYDQASPHTEASGPNAKGKKRELLRVIITVNHVEQITTQICMHNREK